MDTISKQLKDTIRNTMQDGKIYSNEAIRQLIFANAGMKYGEDYKESHFAGSLSALKKSNEIVQIQRGEYKKGNVRSSASNKNLIDMVTSDFQEQKVNEEMAMSKIKNDVMQSVKRELVYLRAVTKDIMLSFDTPGEDLQYVLRVKELIEKLEEFELQMEL